LDFRPQVFNLMRSEAKFDDDARRTHTRTRVFSLVVRDHSEHTHCFTRRSTEAAGRLLQEITLRFAIESLEVGIS
jgi:hypothetical protein